MTRRKAIHGALRLTLTLLLLPWLSLSQFQPGQPPQCLQTSLPFIAAGLLDQGSTRAPPPLYERIRIATNADFDQLVPILLAYIQEPAFSETVTGMIIDVAPWDGMTFVPATLDQLFMEKELFAPVLEREYEALETYVDNLKLGEELTRPLLYWIRWKIYEQKGAWSGPMHRRAEDNAHFARAAAVVLLSMCRNISTLHISCHGPYERVLSDYFLKCNYGLLHKPGLQQLKHVVIIDGTVAGPDNGYTTIEALEYFQYFHRLPAIESISMDGVQEYEPERTIFVPWTGNMKRIHIGHSAFMGDTLATMITIPKRLEDIEISIGGMIPYHGDDVFVSPSEIGKALQEHKKTLRVLDLDIDGGFQFMSANEWPENDFCHWEWTDREYFNFKKEAYGEEYFRMDSNVSAGPLQSLQSLEKSSKTVGSFLHFQSLTHLGISIKALLGPTSSLEAPNELLELPQFHLIDILPPSLEYLRIYGYFLGDNEYFDYQITELMKHRGERLPNLREVWGVDATELGVSATYPHWAEEWPDGKYWQRPVNNLNWREALSG